MLGDRTERFQLIGWCYCPRCDRFEYRDLYRIPMLASFGGILFDPIYRYCEVEQEDREPVRTDPL